MLGKNSSYFDKELCLDGHYIITGHTNDLFCNDLLQVTDLKYELHYHLRNVEGFEAVIFFDSVNMLHCYDQQSYNILRGENTEHIATSDRESLYEEIIASGPRGRRSRYLIDRPTVNNSDSNTTINDNVLLSDHWNMGRQSIRISWEQATALLKNMYRHRCALVFSNMDSLITSMDAQALSIIEELQSYHSSEREKKQSIIIYVFRETSLATLKDSIDTSIGGASNSWSRFVQNVLIKRIDTNIPQNNRVISLRTPNRFEVGNLINSMRLQRKDKLLVDMKSVDRIAEELAASCARQEWSLYRLKTRLELCIAQDSKKVLTIQNLNEFTGENHISPIERVNRMIGMEDRKDENGKLENKGFKSFVRELYASSANKSTNNEIMGYSRLLPLPYNNSVHDHELNICIKGGPGTGKTTIAGLMGELYYQLNMLPQGQVVTCSAADLISGYVGGTPSAIRGKIQEALGGVLFIDEAYALVPESDRNGNTYNAHGQEAITQLVNDLSAYDGQLAVIIAGYPGKMDKFLKANDGLARRFPNVITIEDYTPDEMRQIFIKMAEDSNVSLSDELLDALPNFCEAWVGGKTREWGNAGEVATLLSDMKKKCSVRMLAEESVSENLVLTLDDIPDRLRHCLDPRSEDINQAIIDIERMIGLNNVKSFLKALVNNIRLGVEDRVPGNYIFYGAPGTGKTTVARKMGEILGHLGILSRKVNNVIECRAGDLINGSINLDDLVQDARGGILFIDEAHQLAKESEGQAIIRQLVPMIEDPEIRSDTCFICAGYTVDMKRFLDVDPGMSRRFPLNHRIRFDDYTASELVQILERFAQKRGEKTDCPEFQEYLLRSRVAFENYLVRKPSNFGNGGFIRDVYLPDSIASRTRRLNRKYMGNDDSILTEAVAADISEEERRTLTVEDIPEEFIQFAGPIGREPQGDKNASEIISELYGKQEFSDYIRSILSPENDELFFDGTDKVGMHYSVAGPNGSGRHTAIRAMAFARKELGHLNKSDVIFVGKADLEAGYVGQTAGKTQEIVDQAIGGTLVVMYPSSLLPQSAHDISYGKDALGVIANAMTNHTSDLCVVFLDSEDGMNEFFRVYPSFRGLLCRQFVFDDLDYNDMLLVFKQKTKDNMVFESELESILPDVFLNWVSDRGGLGDSVLSWGNGIEVDRLVEELIQNWKNEDGTIAPCMNTENGLPCSTKKRLITKQMFPNDMKKYFVSNRIVSENALQELETMTGLQSVKESIRVIERRLRLMPNGNVNPGLYCYIGNPGVGKTTVAKLMGGILKATRALSQGHVIVRTARQLCENINEFDKTVRLAKNGILFIDEAHQLVDNPYGNTVIKKLLTIIEDKNVIKDTCFILAGYPKEMACLFDVDPGLASRFGTANSIIRFSDYTSEELVSILKDMASKADSIVQIGTPFPLKLSDEYVSRSAAVFDMVVKSGNNRFGNARFVRNYLHDSVDEMLARLDSQYDVSCNIPIDEKDYLTEDDIPRQYHGILGNIRQSIVIPAVDIVTSNSGKITDNNLDEKFSILSQSVVLLESYAGTVKKGEGTGTIITKNGFVLTCAHVVKGTTRIRARVYSPGMIGGDYRWFECEIYDSCCEECDMAVVKLIGTNFKPLELRPVNCKTKNDEETLLIGFPLGGMLSGNNVNDLAASHFSGRIASVQAVNDVERYYIDSKGLHGNSGSPVISKKDGRMIGVFSGSITPRSKGNLDELNYFYPIKYFWDNYTIPVNDRPPQEE